MYCPDRCNHIPY